ncbi:MAG: formate--tetrahydrofolate ligase [Bryobacteraceae bacterium]|nr:formate--tetrahydrofolate ligase [Bryobacteraceae bacterium]
MSKALLPIQAIADKLEVPRKYVEQLGPYGAKLKLELLKDPDLPRRGKLILVTATTPTVSGEGKTVTAIGLVQGLERIGKKAVITSREPSLGPVFGMKGGAAGAGRSSLEPRDKINLHFHGDFHAITSAHNLLSALIDAHLFHGNDLELDPEGITWPRALDMNDRSLRQITLSVGGKRQGSNRNSEFLITAASEVMAILSLARDRDDLRQRLGSIVIGRARDGRPVRAVELRGIGGMMALLSDAFLPNLVQTTDGTPALVHCGPFANIAHGTSSVVSQEMGLRLADYVVNEVGFASDLGFEKYMDLVIPSSGLEPSAAVLVTTVQSLRNQGEGELERGFVNLQKHIANLREFGVPAVVAINRFPKDTEEQLESVQSFCRQQDVTSALSEAFAKGGEGAAALAEAVVLAIDSHPRPSLRRAYSGEDTAEEKILKVAQKVYGAANVEYSERAAQKLTEFAGWGYGRLPVCIAKTQYSFSDDPKLFGAPAGWTLHITDVKLSAGAGFLVAISGSIVLMPGLPKDSRAIGIDVDAEGEITGMS